MLLVYLYVPGPLAHGRLDPNRYPARAAWTPAAGCLELVPATWPPTPATRQEHTQRRPAENPF